ncbi:low specificity L-threonine aldolase [Tropicimonas sp. IMCC34011]|uniref:threonine aldolase family protein n=1 Tax=Tropicimonas sp. IMCC34011 TaxID=2248759 RepID=UPI000E26B74C|nr:beta-eliminating lyase-related protein [Tropicimonas sp. IMCC34011]
MFFASDNTGPVHPSVMEALSAANEGYLPSYGAEDAMDRVTARLREILGAPQAEVRLVATGTAANALLLATLSRPWDTIFCHELAHIEQDECGAPEFYSDAKLTLVTGPDAKMDPDALEAAITASATGGRSVHQVQAGPVSLTNVTERGTLYTVDEVTTLAGVARAHGLPVHMDGSRFANAVAALGCAPSDLVRDLDALSFGGTKNGCMGVEAAVIFDPEKAWEFDLRRKRGAHLFSKHRYLTAQMEAYLADGLWLDLAGRANATCARLAEGLASVPDISLMHRHEANMIFFEAPRALHAALHAKGARYATMAPLEGDGAARIGARLVCDWSAKEEMVDAFVEAARAG